MNIKAKILNFFLINKNKGINSIGLITLDRYLVNVENEKNYVGSFLSNEIKDMVEKKLIEKKDDKYAITDDGIEYLTLNLN